MSNMSNPDELHDRTSIDSFDEPLDPELAKNIARIKTSLDNIAQLWENLRHLYILPTNAEIEAMAKEDDEIDRWNYRNNEELDRVLEEGFYGPEPPEYVLERLALNEILEKEGVIYVG